MNKEDHERIEAYLDDRLTENELSQFKSDLEKNSKLREELALAIKLHGCSSVIEQGQQWGGEEQVMQRIARFEQDQFEDRVMLNLKSEQQTYSPDPKWGKLIFYTIAAQVLVTVILSFLVLSNRAPDDYRELVLGKVQSFEGKCFIVRGENKLMPNKEMTILHGDQLFVEEEGHLNFSYQDGSVLKFLNYSYAQLNHSRSGKRVLLFSGSLTGDIEEQPEGKPLKVITEHSESIVLGTKIEINSSDLSTLLQVKEGKVKMVPKNFKSNDGITVGASQYAVGKNGNDVSLHQIQAPLVSSDVITKDTPGHGVDIDVLLHGAEKLYLVVDKAHSGISFDHVGWHKPVVYSATGNVLLTEKEWVFEKCGWLRSRINRGYHRKEVYINNQQVNDVIVTHSNSVIVYDLPAGAKRFTAKAALLKSGIEQENSTSSVRFEVYTDFPQEKLNAKLRK